MKMNRKSKRKMLNKRLITMRGFLNNKRWKNKNNPK